MPTYKLTYFDVRALGEPIRMLLAYMGQEFEDVRLSFDEWMKIKSTSPFGKLPTLEVDGKIITQSAAICRYLGREAGLAGDNAWEDLQIDIIVDTFTDFRKDAEPPYEDGPFCRFAQKSTQLTTSQVSGFHHEPDAETKEKKRLALLEQTVPFYFEKFDKIVKENNGYVANGKLSWADISLFGFSDTLNAQLQEDVFSRFPNMKGWRETMANIPSIKEWISKRPNTKL